jgi:ribosome biogenesis GTPase
VSRPASHQYDESDVRVRPSRRGTRPRTKDRPRHEDAEHGLVVGVDRGRYQVLVGSSLDERTVVAMRARELGRKGIVVGDEVALVGETSGGADALARIVRVEERRTVLRRTADDTDPYERVVVANADQLAVVTALADPEPRPRMVDRCLVAAYDAGLDPLLVLTKADLADPAPFLGSYAPLDVPYVVTHVRPDGSIVGVEALRQRLESRRSVFVGHSGVGKSTLVNALAGAAVMPVQAIRDADGKGRHTTAYRNLVPLPGGGAVLDTPGIRGVGLLDTAQGLDRAFADIAELAAHCRYGDCRHGAEPGCAVAAALDNGSLSARRLASWRKLRHEVEVESARQHARQAAAGGHRRRRL